MHRAALRVSLLVAVLIGPAALLLTGCSGPAQVGAPSPSGSTASSCRRLVEATPATVDDQSRRDVSPTSPYTTAWGDPPITLACGVTRPAGLTAASECFEVNGIGWYAEQRDDGYRFTTIGRTAYVQVWVPDDYGPQPGNALIDLAGSVRDHLPVVTPCS